MDGFIPHVLIALLVTAGVLALGVVGFLGYLRRRRIASFWAWASIVLIGAFFLWGASLGWVASYGDSGRWSCVVCGRLERRTVYFGIPVLRTDDVAGLCEAEESAAYEAWYWRRFGWDHEHDWHPVGCHSIELSTVQCHGSWVKSVFPATMTRLSDFEVADDLMERWVQATPEQRRWLLRVILEPEDEQPPFVTIWDAEDEVPLDIRREQAESWLEAHPEWRLSGR